MIWLVYQAEEEHLLVRPKCSLWIEDSILGNFFCRPLRRDSWRSTELLDQLWES